MLALTFPIPFILAILIPALLELIKPCDPGPKIISDMTSHRNLWHEKLMDIEPFIPDLITEKTRGGCKIFLGTESLPNIEVFS